LFIYFLQPARIFCDGETDYFGVNRVLIAGCDPAKKFPVWGNDAMDVDFARAGAAVVRAAPLAGGSSRALPLQASAAIIGRRRLR